MCFYQVGDPEPQMYIIGYRYYILKEIGLTTLMPNRGQNYINLPDKMAITYNYDMNGKKKENAVKTCETRPFLIPKGFTQDVEVINGDRDNGKVYAYNWLGQENELTPIASLLIGEGKFITSTVAMDKNKFLFGIIPDTIPNNLSLIKRS